MRTTYTGARPYGTVDGTHLYQYMECMFVPDEMIPRGHGERQITDGWHELHDRYEDSTGHHFVWRRELKINTMAYGFGDVVSLDEARRLETGRIVIRNDFLITRVIWENLEQLVD